MKVIWEFRTINGKLYYRYVGWRKEDWEVRFSTETYPDWKEYGN